jgi:putative transposase
MLRRPIDSAQYTAVLFTKRCAKAGIEVSMGSVGDCYDNAVCETFHASLKKGRIYRQSWPTRTAARTAIFTYIEGWYNPRRRHSTLDYLSPVEFERQHAELAQPAFETPKSGNGSVASTSPRASNGLTTRRISTVGVDLVADGLPISLRERTRVPSGSARAAPDAVQGPTAHRRPLRPVVKEQAR